MAWIENSKIAEVKPPKSSVPNSYEFKGASDIISDITRLESEQHDALSDSELEKMLNSNFDVVESQDNLRKFNGETIENNDQSISNFTQIRSLLSQNLSWKFPKLDSILAEGEALLNADKPLPDLELSELLADITQEAVDYLKVPQNRETLVTVSRELEQSNPAQFRDFKTFLISQDADFKQIFETISYPLSENETTILTALPNRPKKSSEGYTAQLDKDTSVMVMQNGSDVSRSLALWKAKLSTEVLEVDMAEEYESYQAEMERLGWEQSNLTHIQTLVEASDTADISELIKAYPTEFAATGLSSITDKQAMLTAIKTKLGEITKTIEKVETEYRRVISDAVRTTRELYKTIDQKAKQTLLRLRNLGLDKWNLEALIREMVAGLLIPDLGVTLAMDNIDLAKQNFLEPESLTAGFDVFNDNLTRFANKGLTGNPEGLDENGKLIGFSLETARLNPNAQTKTEGELIHLMESQGIMSGGVFNLNKVRENLRKPIEV